MLNRAKPSAAIPVRKKWKLRIVRSRSNATPIEIGQLAGVLGQLLAQHRLHLVAAPAGLADARQPEHHRARRGGRAAKNTHRQLSGPATTPGDAAGEERGRGPGRRSRSVP